MHEAFEVFLLDKPKTTKVFTSRKKALEHIVDMGSLGIYCSYRIIRDARKEVKTQ